MDVLILRVSSGKMVDEINAMLEGVLEKATLPWWERSVLFQCSTAKAPPVEAFLTNITSIRELVSYRKSNRCIHKDWHPGCTAIVAIVSGNNLFVTNRGDCRAILCRASIPIALSKVSC
ncbi:phosphatase 2C family protein [Medicago truncatula]|uniref:Phosphatase 2C family protein n=1 Tax=Medicago truncatula TaxID=3880 RepID=G7KBD7_MEDTR|nr:phosphatase 2C family protein [Medicago truncatula]